MHGSMGGSWNRSVATATRTWAPGGNAGAVRRGLPPVNATAPAPYPTATDLPGSFQLRPISLPMNFLRTVSIANPPSGVGRRGAGDFRRNPAER